VTPLCLLIATKLDSSMHNILGWGALATRGGDAALGDEWEQRLVATKSNLLLPSFSGPDDYARIFGYVSSIIA
jgi:hypothetical protein